MNKTLAIILWGLAGLAGILGLYFQRQAAPEYVAHAVVKPVRDHTDLGELGTNAPSGMAQMVFLQNEADIIRSEAVAQLLPAPLRPERPRWGKVISTQILEAGETIQISACATSAATAPPLANAVAEAYCEYRLARRQRLAREALEALQPLFAEQERQVQAARDELSAARQAVGAGRSAAELTPPASGTESEPLRQLRGQLSQVTMALLTQTNQLAQLARNENFPPEELQKVREQVERVQTRFDELTAAVARESQRQQALQRYWQAAAELERAEKMFAPLQNARAAQERDLAAQGSPPAEIVTRAEVAELLPAPQKNWSTAGLLTAAGFLLAGGWAWFGARPHSRNGAKQG